MASGTRSSKRKSPPSHKKKLRIKDRSKKRSKIRKGKSKKVSRRESPDSYSDNESLSPASSFSYSSTDSDSRRRSRSRTRKDMIKRRKNSRRSPLRSKRSEKIIKDKRGKRSKKSKDTDAKKKRLRKKYRRELSISSSSRSLSCSTCGSSENEKTEKEVKRKGRSRREDGEDRRWCDHRSRSRSPCRLDGGDDSYPIEEQRLVENNPRRLRSIIIFAKEFEEEETEVLGRDVNKEEIIYDKDDYPSPRSNGSNDGRIECLEDEHDEMVGSKIRISELSEKCDLGVMEHDLNASAFDGVGVGNSIGEHEANVPNANAGSNEADLEAVLRQKALENLKKFKGGARASAQKRVSTKSSYDGEVKQSSGMNADLELHKKDIIMSTMQESSASSAVESLHVLPQDSKMVNPSEKGGADDDRFEGSEIQALASDEGNLGADKLVEQAIPTQEKPVLNTPTTESLPLADFVDDVKDGLETGALTLIQCDGSNKVDSQMIPIQESSILMAEPTQTKDTVESLHLSHDTKMVTDDVVKSTTGVSSSDTSNLEGQSSNAKGNDDGGSQFQQKTMSVMRGGEMVQVSYKVYIPKHAPALARRKLKR